jgi:D-galactarolactone isomerase
VNRAAEARRALPDGACDCHMHLFQPHFADPPKTGTPLAGIDGYRALQARLGLQRVVVVQANAYGDDNRGVLEALAAFGDTARGIVVVRPQLDEAQLQAMHAQGARGVRFHLLPGGALGWDDLDAVVARIRPFGWHVQIQLDGWQLPQHVDRLRALPVPVVIDHIGKYLAHGVPQPDDPAFRALQRLVDAGHAWVKLSAPYETSHNAAPDYDDVSRLARTLAASHPERCLWASNWPHPGRQPVPDDGALLDLLAQWAPNDHSRRRILVHNPAALYGFGPDTETPP